MLNNPDESPNKRQSSLQQMRKRRRRLRGWRESILGLLALTVMVLISGALFVLVAQVIAPWSGYPRVVIASYSILFLTVCAMTCGWDPSAVWRQRK